MSEKFKCGYCGKEFDHPVTSGHKRKCPEFISAHPVDERKPSACLCGYEANSLTQMKRHRGCASTVCNNNPVDGLAERTNNFKRVLAETGYTTGF